MRESKRIGIELLDPNLRSLIDASTKIFPVNIAYVQAETNPNNYDYVRIMDGIERNNIYIWQSDTLTWSLIGADDAEIFWADILNKPTTFAPETHNHDDRYYTEDEMNASLASKANVTDLPVLSPVATSGNYADLSGKPTIPTDTNQLAKTDVFTKTEVNASLASKSDSTHDHDGRYNTKSEVTSLLANKSDITHNHDSAYAVKSTETTVGNHASLLTGLRTDVDTNTTDIAAIETNMANGDMHSNISVLNQLTQALLDAWNSAVTHISDTVKHITGEERLSWNAKSDFSGAYTDLTGKPIIPIATSELANDSGYQTSTDVSAAISGKADKTYVDTQDASKVDSSTFTGHTGNTTVHVTQTDKDKWNGISDEITVSTTQPITSMWYKVV
jgi:hypothetical protein